MATSTYRNTRAVPTLVGAAPSRDPLAFHQRLPDYAPTPLIDAPALARALDVGRVWVKDESYRLGLPAFKMLGASWAVQRALRDRFGAAIAPSDTLDELRARLAPLRPLTVVTATDGNHGRAVARMARLLGLAAHILVPAGAAAARVEAIAGEGAAVTLVAGSYDEAVAQAADEADDRRLVVSDTSWPGYEDVPRQIIEGYSTIFWEIDDELARRGEEDPDVVAVQIGVGALAAATVRHYRQPRSGATSRTSRTPRTRIVGVEPTGAACILNSLRAGRIVNVPGPHDSIMAGLNCGTPSLVAWPLLRAGIDLAVAIDDERARQAMRDLAAAGVVAGETGASGLGGLMEALTGAAARASRTALAVDRASRVLVLATEGATDPAAYERIVGRPATGRIGSL